jgi:homoserine kinase type II
MAVYTDVSDEVLETFLQGYDLGEVLAFKGIAEGVENSNFYLHTSKGMFILTLYEKRVREDDLPFFMGLIAHLADKGLPCPRPVADRANRIINPLAGRKAALVTFLEGISHRRPSPLHCGELGRALARLHEAGSNFDQRRPNALGKDSWSGLAQSCLVRADTLSPGFADRIRSAMERLEKNWPQDLPQGIIHGDLFPDNVFFRGNALSGLIDFYFACTDSLSYDLAICLNAWCFEADGSYNLTKGQALLQGYASLRPLSVAEQRALARLCEGAALRFLLTRLIDWLNVPEGAQVRPKDPLEYDRKLAFHSRMYEARDYGYD